MDEPFLMTYIEPLRRRMREQVLLHLIKPYRKITFDFLSKELNIQVEEVEMLIVDMILENRMIAQIDQINKCVEIGEMDINRHLKIKKLQALGKWADAITNYSENFYEKLSLS
tara:strand:- start:296 stop:634 length:339 start_codon:yes stop_codon:yes gene_type:complete